MICLSRYDLEQIAQRVLRAYIMKCSQGRQPECIDPELLVADVLGLYMDAHRLSLNGQVLGLTAFSPIGISVYDTDGSECFYELDGNTILIDSELYDDPQKTGRRNFTIMHEASHQILHMLYPNEYGIHNRLAVPVHYSMRDSYEGRPIRNWDEWQANALASALLLPGFAIVSGMKKMGLGDRIKILNSLYRRKEFSAFEELAVSLGTSKKALAIRMKQLGLLEKDYLEHPRAMLDIFPEEGL